MRIETFGAWVIGGVLLAVGLAVPFSNIDPALLCFKQCNVPKALSALFGSELLRVAIGLFFSVLGLLFIAPLIVKLRSAKQ
jgi:hypothetical protein